MNIAVVGGGTRCRLLLEMIEKNVFYELGAVMVAVARRIPAPGTAGGGNPLPPARGCPAGGGETRGAPPPKV